MPKASTRSTVRPGRLAAVVLVAAMAVLSSCGGVKTDPRDYGDAYKENFMLGCTGKEANGTVPNDGQVLASKSYCECVYNGLTKTVPFDEAKQFEEAQAKAETGADIKVPKNIQSVFDKCKPKQ